MTSLEDLLARVEPLYLRLSSGHQGLIDSIKRQHAEGIEPSPAQLRELLTLLENANAQ